MVSEHVVSFSCVVTAIFRGKVGDLEGHQHVCFSGFFWHVVDLPASFYKGYGTGFIGLERSSRRSTIECMDVSIWKDCQLVSVDPEVRHGEPVFAGTRMPVEGAIESVLAYQELNGLSEDLAIEQTVRDHPTIPSADALRAVLAFDAAHEHLLIP